MEPNPYTEDYYDYDYTFEEESPDFDVRDELESDPEELFFLAEAWMEEGIL